MHTDQEWLEDESTEGMSGGLGTSSMKVCVGFCPDSSCIDRTVRSKGMSQVDKGSCCKITQGPCSRRWSEEVDRVY